MHEIIKGTVVLEALYMTRKLSGMVINAFTTPVELPLEVVAKMRELLLKMKEDGTID